MKKMRKHAKKVLCMALSVAMLFTSTGMAVFAEEESVQAEETQQELDVAETEDTLAEEEITEEDSVKEETTEQISGEKDSYEDVEEITLTDGNSNENDTTKEQTDDEDVLAEEDLTEKTETEVVSTGASDDAEETEVSENELKLAFSDADIANGEYKEGGNNITWVIDADGKLTVEGTGEFTSQQFYIADRVPWYDKRSYIKTAEINVTGMKTASYMFSGCSNLESIDLSGFDTSSVIYMNYMFDNCSSLTELDLNNFDTSSVTAMWMMFDKCSGLTELDLSNFDTSSVTNMNGMFSDCSSLKNLDISHFDTSSVTNIGSMFYNCSNLTNLNISHFDTSSVTTMNGMFMGCSSLTSLDVSHFDTSNVTTMNFMFYKCNSLMSLDVSHFDTSNVTDVGSMFFDCSNLTELDLSNFDTSNVTSMSCMFWGCSSLTNLDLSHFDTSSVTTMYGMFSNCSNLTSLDISHFDTSSVTDMSYMFGFCSSLTNLDLSHFDTGSVTTMMDMFYDCGSLTSLDVSHFDTGSVTIMYGMFDGCSSLTSLDVSHFDTSNVTDMVNMFGDCSSLTSLNLSSFDMSNITTNVSNLLCLNECNSLTAIYTPRNLKEMVYLPLDSNNSWYYTIKEGDEEPKVVYVSSFPQDSESSILLLRGSSPADPPARKESITVKKTKTAYYCGESIETDDLTVQYYGMDGTIRKVTDYTTDAESIDMSTTGNKTLTVSYTSAGTGEALTAAVTLTVTYSIENALTVTLPDETYVYNRTVHKPAPTVTYTANGTEKVLTEETDYTVSYRNNKNAYQSADADEDPNAPAVIIKGCGEYGGTVIKTFAIRKADAPKEAEMTQEIYDYETEKQSRKLSLSDSFAKYGDKTGYILGTPIEDDTISGSVLSGEHSVSKGGMLTYSTNAGSEGDFVTIPVTVSFVNYEDSVLNVKIKFVKKEATEKVSISGIEMKDGIYQKRPVSPTGTAKVTAADGTDVTDAVSLVYTYSGTQADGSAYAAATTAPTNAGSYKLTVSVAQNDKNYTGSAVYSFSIAKAPLTITARDMGLKIGASLPNAADFQYDTAGLFEGDQLTTEPTFACSIANTAEEGTYDITVSGADAGMNYEITYKNGTLTVSEEGESAKYYTVTFNLSGHGSDITNTGVKEGSLLEKPQDPQTDGYTFTGWYKDQSCTVLWDFDKDTVQSDTILYAGWTKNSTTGGDDEDDSPYDDSERTDLASASVNGTIATNIKAKVYDGNAYEPVVKVTVTETVNGGKKKITLTEGTDYRVLYQDNTNAGEGKVIVKGNGIYKGEIEKTFTINPKPVKKLKVLTSGIVGTATKQAASGAVYVYDGTKRLVENVDYELSDVQPVKNKTDVVQVTVKGKSNYNGEVTTKITVYESGTDLSKLITPDNVTLVPESSAKSAAKATQEAYAYTGKAIKPAVTVTIGGVALTTKDYKVQYQNNKDAGTAYVVVTGKGAYKGKAVIPFTIKAETVANANDFAIKAIKDMTYNGKLQNPAVKVTIQKNGKTKNLSKKDYTVVYKSNLHAGNATVTVTGKGNYAGLSATITFKINPQQIKKASLKGTQGNLVLTYSKRTLKEGTDYETPVYGTVNKNKVPVTITGKGDFTGEMTKTVKTQ